MNQYIDFSKHKFFEITASTGEYTNAQGEKKKKYQKIGVIHDSKHGPTLKLDLIPLQWEGYAYINEPYKKDETKPNDQQANRKSDTSHDDIPW